MDFVPPMLNTTLRMSQPVATILSERLFEIVGLVGVVKIVMGMWLNWKITWLRSDAEEAAKDGRITERAARARIKFYEWFFPFLIISGIALLAIAMYGMSES